MDQWLLLTLPSLLCKPGSLYLSSCACTTIACVERWGRKPVSLVSWVHTWRETVPWGLKVRILPGPLPGASSTPYWDDVDGERLDFELVGFRWGFRLRVDAVMGCFSCETWERVREQSSRGQQVDYERRNFVMTQRDPNIRPRSTSLVYSPPLKCKKNLWMSWGVTPRSCYKDFA